MSYEVSSLESGFYTCWSREWGKKKSTSSLAKPESGASKPEIKQSSEKKAPEPPSRGTESSVVPTEDALPEVLNEVQESEKSKLAATPSLVTTSSNSRKETPSLFNRKKPELKEEGGSQVEKKSESFDEDTLKQKWQEFCEMRISNGAGDAEKLLFSRSVKKVSDEQLEIHLGSKLEMSILEKFEQELIQYLRVRLNNDLIVLNKTVQAQEESQKLYTSQDKFDFMVKENPSLKGLKEKLGLDFEY